MLGAIIGDIVGSRWEFNPTNDYNFEWLSDQNGFTDDTICTVAVADALLHGRDFGESIHDWCNRYPHPMGGYGGRFAQWVRSDKPQPYNSFGNGAAMRPSPVAYSFKYIDSMNVAIDIVSMADIFVVVGTSLKVYPAAGFINYAHHEVPKFVIDPGEMEQCTQLGFTHFKTTATEGMKMLLEAFKEL